MGAHSLNGLIGKSRLGPPEEFTIPVALSDLIKPFRIGSDISVVLQSKFPPALNWTCRFHTLLAILLKE